MSLTKITEKVITPGSIDANSLAENISVGGVGQKLTVDQIIITDSNFANTSDTSIPTTGGYLKLYGNNFTSNSNVYLSTTFSPDTQVTANVISNNEIRITISTTSENTYNLFVFNQKGKFAFKENVVTTFFQQETTGWVAGGRSSPPDLTGFSLIERLNFSDDTGTLLSRNNFSDGRIGLSAVKNLTYGWFGGGRRTTPTTPISTVDRLTFLDDTNNLSVRGPLSRARNLIASTGNQNYGWFGGGTPGPFSTVDRIDFAADTGTALERGPLSVGRNHMGATGNENYGWFGSNVPASSRVDRIDFADDTTTASIRGPLSVARGAIGATGNENYGWFAGGIPSGSRVDRINFADDTTTASIRGPLSSGGYRRTATGNDNYGWIAGGETGSVTISTVNRITFSDDTVTASLRGPLSASRDQLSSTSGVS